MSLASDLSSLRADLAALVARVKALVAWWTAHRRDASGG